jgi:hypothetical protein
MFGGVVGDVEAEFGTHGEHGGVFRKHLAMHSFEILAVGKIDHLVHQQPTDSVDLES